MNPKDDDYLRLYVDLDDRVSPAAKVHLIRNKIYAKDVLATGRRGMVLKQDVLAYLSDPQKYARKEKKFIEKYKQPQKVTQGFKIAEITHQDQVVKLDKGMKKRMNRVMAQSRSIPSFTFTDEYDITNLLEFEKEHYSMMAMVIKSISIGLTNFPILNSHVNPGVDEDGYIKEYALKNDHNICIAHSVNAGLTLPSLQNVQSMSLSSIEKALPTLSEPTMDEDKSESSSFTLYYNESGSNLYPNIIRPHT